MTALFTLLPDAVTTVDADSKQAILQRLAERFAAVYSLDPSLVLSGSKSAKSLDRLASAAGLPFPMPEFPT